MGELGIALDCEGAFCIRQGVNASFCNKHDDNVARCTRRVRFLARYITEREAVARGISLKRSRAVARAQRKRQ